MKRFISILLVLTLSLGLLGGASLTAFADEEIPDEAVVTVDSASDDVEAPADSAQEEAPASAADEAPVVEEASQQDGETPDEADEAVVDEPADVADADQIDEAADVDDAAEIDEAPAQDGASAFKEAKGLVAGQNYVFVLSSEGGKVTVLKADGTKLVTATVDKAEIGADTTTVWTASADSSSSLLNVGTGTYLYYDSTAGGYALGSSAKANWKFASSMLYYEGEKATNYAVTAVGADGTVTATSGAGGNAKGATLTIYTDGASEGTAATSGGGKKDSTSSTSSGTTYTKAKEVNKTYAAFVVDGYTFGLKTGSLTYTAVTVSNDSITAADGAYVKVVSADTGFYLVVNDPPESTVYLYIDESGALANTDKDGTTAPDGHWTFSKGVLAYVNGNTTYYVTGASASGLTIATKEPRPDTVTVYTGDSAPSKSGTGGGDKDDGNSDTDTVDDDGPTFVTQPTAAPYVIEDSDYAAPTYTATAQRPDGAAKVTSITFQWFVGDDDHPITNPVEIALDENGQATSTVSPSALQGLSYGVYLVYCKATCTRSDGDHSNNSNKVSFIVTKGVKDNTFLTFSDVHETFTNISYAINDTISVYGGFIPALIICTGDWANSYYSEFKASDDDTLATYKATTYNDYILRMAALVGGIDIVYVAGNHDNTSAAEQANLEAGLGVESDGSGVIYDNTNPDAKLVSSANSDDLVVFGINYNDIAVNGGYSYVNVIPELNTFLQGLVDKDYAGVVVISAHAGLHALTIDEMSSADQDGDNDYNIDLSDEMVTMLNDYAEKGLTIMFLFGHDHSKGESEFSKVTGDEIVSYHEYKAGTYETLTVKFAYYGHSGYITNTIGGSEKYTVVEYDGKTILSLEGAEDADLRTKISGKATALPDENIWYALINTTVAESNYLKASLKTSDTDLLTAISSNEKLKPAIDAGETVELSLFVEKEINLSAEARQAIDTFLNKVDSKLQVGEYLDITLWAGAGENNYQGFITDTGIPVTISITIPDELYKSNYSYQIVRYHNGVVSLITPEQDGKTLTFETDQFSLYALAYKEVAVQNPAASANNQNTTSRTPKTGDETPVVLWAVLFLSCTAGVVALVPKTKKH